VEAHPTSTANVAKLLFTLLANHSQADFRNKIVSLSRVRWIQTKDE
jgi:hypothetical protein